jgi:TatD DNase family protein
MYVDSHAHLHDDEFASDLAEVTARAREAEISRIVLIGEDAENSAHAVEVATSDPIYLATVGVHPHQASTWNADISAKIRELTAAPQVVGIGEIGLDYHYDFSPREAQKRLSRSDGTREGVASAGRNPLPRSIR